MARNVLADRLGRLVEEGILERSRYQERPERFEYRLTQKGIDLWPVLVSLMKWGDRHAPADDGPPTLVFHRDCGGEVDERLSARSAAPRSTPTPRRLGRGPARPTMAHRRPLKRHAQVPRRTRISPTRPAQTPTIPRPSASEPSAIGT